MGDMKAEPTEKDAPAAPRSSVIRLEKVGDGVWEISSNIDNPNRVIILVAANLVTKLLG